MSSKMITLKSSDGESFEVDEAVAMESGKIKHMMEDHCTDKQISLPNVTSKTLSKVIEYCKKHAEAANHDDKSSGLKAWDAEYMKVDHSTLFDLIDAANYLNIESLTDLTWQTIAYMIRDNTVEEIREIFNVKHDFTRDEEHGLRVNSNTKELLL